MKTKDLIVIPALTNSVKTEDELLHTFHTNNNNREPFQERLIEELLSCSHCRINISIEPRMPRFLRKKTDFKKTVEINPKKGDLHRRAYYISEQRRTLLAGTQP